MSHYEHCHENYEDIGEYLYKKNEKSENEDFLCYSKSESRFIETFLIVLVATKCKK